MNYARILGNVAVDVSTDPAAHFHPTLAAAFEAVPDAVRPGWRLVDGTWSAPEPADPGATARAPEVSAVRFQLLFTVAERIAVRTSDDPVIQDWHTFLADPRVTVVDLGLPAVQDALAYLESAGVLAAGRADQIIANQAP